MASFSNPDHSSSLEIYRQYCKYAKRHGFCFVVASNYHLFEYIHTELKTPHYIAGYNYPIFLDPVRVYFTVNSDDKIELTDSDLACGFVELQSISGKDCIDLAKYSHQTQFMLIYGLTHDIIDKFINSIIKKYKPVSVVDNSGHLYEWDVQYACYRETGQRCLKIDRNDLKGVDTYFDDISRDIEILQTKEEILAKMGIGSGFNYLLYGNPGTGKSSFVKIIAHHYKIPIFTINLNVVKSEFINKALTPTGYNMSSLIVLVEDFDRYLVSEEGRSKVSELLNALDGMFPGKNIIRFFSANNPEKITDEALISRMRRVLYFPNPTNVVLFDHIKHIMSTSDECINLFIETLYQHDLSNLSIRTINLFLSRFILEDDPVVSATDKIPEWASELKKLNTITHINHATVDVDYDDEESDYDYE